jgi:hypothetical protein
MSNTKSNDHRMYCNICDDTHAKRTNRLGVRALLALMAFGAILGAALFYSVPAHATPSQDQQFLNLLSAEGITPGVQAINIAHNICASVWSGVSPYTWVSAVYYDNAIATWDDATAFVGDAILSYCPPAGTSAPTQSAPNQTGWVA